MRTSGLVANFPHSIHASGVETCRPRDEVVAELFDQHASGLYRLCLAMLKDADQAQDAVQDTFVRLISHVESGRPLSNARGWLYTVAAHACRDRQRRVRRWLPWQPALDTRSATETPDASAGRDAVLCAIRTLGHRDRLLIALRAQGLDYQDIATATGVRPSSVGRLLARALDRLAHQLRWEKRS